jgi:NAD(P)-dependent dehydrogenase (short-subunit alcohol dehydrogenase family)
MHYFFGASREPRIGARCRWLGGPCRLARNPNQARLRFHWQVGRDYRRLARSRTRAAENIRARHTSAEVLIVSADVREHADVERAIAETIGHYGRIDVVINHAGIIQVGPLDHMKLSDYDDAMNTDF